METELSLILGDTDVLIDALRGKPSRQRLLASLDISEMSMSVITEMEPYRGARDKRELALLNRHLQSFSIVDITPEISRIAADLVFKYTKSHSMQIPDAFIAATALSNNAALLTYNSKHFKFIPNLQLYL